MKDFIKNNRVTVGFATLIILMVVLGIVLST